MRRAALALCLSAILAGALAESTSACTIDGKPSAFAAGTRAVIARGAPTAATYAYWAIFAFPRAFRQGQRIAFHEDDALVRPLLTQADLARSWRWRFGDGAWALGDHVTHRYRRTGKYKVAVDAYFPTAKGWYQFDSITITIVR